MVILVRMWLSLNCYVLCMMVLRLQCCWCVGLKFQWMFDLCIYVVMVFRLLLVNLNLVCIGVVCVRLSSWLVVVWVLVMVSSLVVIESSGLVWVRVWLVRCICSWCVGWQLLVILLRLKLVMINGVQVLMLGYIIMMLCGCSVGLFLRRLSSILCSILICCVGL